MKSSNFSVLLLFIVLSLILAVGCSSEDDSCSVTSDCSVGMRCVNKTCINLQCSTELDCLGDEYCAVPAGSTVGTCLKNNPDGDTEVDGDDGIVSNCVEGVLRCRGDIKESCKLQNNTIDWRFEEECSNGCQFGMCLEPDGDEDGDVEQEAQAICEANDLRCFGNVVQECSEDGMEWRLNDACVDESCIEIPPDAYCGVCYPGMRDCEASTGAVLICNADGTRWDKQFCGTREECLAGYCVSDDECSPGRYNCAGNVVQKCNSAGTGWDTFDSCISGETCKCGSWAGTQCTQAACIADLICSPLQDTQCSGDTVQRCNADGTGWASWSDCSAKDPPETCVNGACQ